MGVEDIFEGARNVFTFFNAYRAGVANAIGAEQALAMDKKIFETLGTMQGQMLKEQAGDKEFDVKEASELVKGFLRGIGIHLEVLEESPTMVRHKFGPCPVYEGSQRAGLDQEAREAMCRSGGFTYMGALVKALNPNLSYQLMKFRSAPEDFCEEAIVLEK